MACPNTPNLDESPIVCLDTLYQRLAGEGLSVRWIGSHGGRHLLVEGLDMRGVPCGYHIRNADAPYPQLLSIICGQRDPIIMSGVSRIVGYFSHVKNWNKSKVGELHDRQAGNYHVEAAE